MAFQNVGGLDHVVIMVKGLEAAAEQWRQLGFAVSPRGVHSAHVGAANHTIVLPSAYIELMGVLRETDANAPSRAFLEKRGDGIERIALRTDDAAAAADELRQAAIAATGPFAFGRPVPLPDGSEIEASFRIARWPVTAAPGGMRLFVCEHETPDAVWRSELMAHANGAQRIDRLEVATSDPLTEARAMAGLVGASLGDKTEDQAAVRLDGGVRVVFATAKCLRQRYPWLDEETTRLDGAMSVVLRVGDLAAVAGHLGSRGRAQAGKVCVAPAQASGVLVVFEAES